MKIITLFTILILIISGCKKDWLEEKANKRQAIASSLKDFQALLDNTFTMNNNVFGYGDVAADGHFAPDGAWAGAGTNARNVYTWSHIFPYTKLSNWTSTYGRVFTCNIVLEGLEKIEPITSEDNTSLINIKGQALFNRAETFLHLAQVFAAPYSSSSAQSDLGIPLRLNSDITEVSTRSSVAGTYEQIIRDTKIAADLLPVTPLYATRGSKPAAYGLLARTYLLRAEYDSALSYANKCLQLFSTLMDYRQYSSTQTNFGLFPPEVIFHNRAYTSEISDFLTSNYLIDTSLFNQFASNDLRKSLFFKVNTNNTISFKGNYNNSSTAWFYGIASDEIYLIKAECLARIGNYNEAINVLNVLLAKRFDNTFTFYTASNANEALVKILQERRKELILRGVRWSDLRRLNMDDRFKVTLTRTIGGNTYTLEPNSYKYTFPIPDDVIQISGMPQNPGW